MTDSREIWTITDYKQKRAASLRSFLLKAIRINRSPSCYATCRKTRGDSVMAKCKHFAATLGLLVFSINLSA